MQHLAQFNIQKTFNLELWLETNKLWNVQSVRDPNSAMIRYQLRDHLIRRFSCEEIKTQRDGLNKWKFDSM